MVCPNCDRTTEADWQFCAYCGWPAQQGCPHGCGARLSVSREAPGECPGCERWLRHCPRCGRAYAIEADECSAASIHPPGTRALGDPPSARVFAGAGRGEARSVVDLPGTEDPLPPGGRFVEPDRLDPAGTPIAYRRRWIFADSGGRLVCLRQPGARASRAVTPLDVAWSTGPLLAVGKPEVLVGRPAGGVTYSCWRQWLICLDAAGTVTTIDARDGSQALRRRGEYQGLLCHDGVVYLLAAGAAHAERWSIGGLRDAAGGAPEARWDLPDTAPGSIVAMEWANGAPHLTRRDGGVLALYEGRPTAEVLRRPDRRQICGLVSRPDAFYLFLRDENGHSVFCNRADGTAQAATYPMGVLSDPLFCATSQWILVAEQGSPCVLRQFHADYPAEEYGSAQALGPGALWSMVAIERGAGDALLIVAMGTGTGPGGRVRYSVREAHGTGWPSSVPERERTIPRVCDPCLLYSAGSLVVWKRRLLPEVEERIESM